MFFSVPCYGRSRNFEQKGVGYNKGALETENHTELQRNSTPQVGGELSLYLIDGRESPGRQLLHWHVGTNDSALQWRRMSPVLLSWKHLHLEVSCSGINLLMKTHQCTKAGVAQLRAGCAQEVRLLSCKQSLIKTSVELSSVTTAVIVRIYEVNKG